MNNCNYSVDINNIYIGKVFKIYGSYNKSDVERDINKRSYHSFQRHMLFCVNEDGLANDLLYNSPEYPIMNITPDDLLVNKTGIDTIIAEPYKISDLLKYLDYNDELTYQDILNIRKNIINKKFLDSNYQLFGLKKKDKGYKVVPNGRFPLDCYYAILEACDSSSINMVGNFVLFGFKEDRFKPSKEEGPVKKLTK